MPVCQFNPHSPQLRPEPQRCAAQRHCPRVHQRSAPHRRARAVAGGVRGLPLQPPGTNAIGPSSASLCVPVEGRLATAGEVCCSPGVKETPVPAGWGEQQARTSAGGTAGAGVCGI